MKIRPAPNRIAGLRSVDPREENMSPRPATAPATWTDARIELLKQLWGEGASCSQIATALGGLSRNAVIGKVHRLALPRPERKRARPPRQPRQPRGGAQVEVDPACTLYGSRLGQVEIACAGARGRAGANRGRAWLPPWRSINSMPPSHSSSGARCCSSPDRAATGRSASRASRTSSFAGGGSRPAIRIAPATVVSPIDRRKLMAATCATVRSAARTSRIASRPARG